MSYAVSIVYLIPLLMAGALPLRSAGPVDEKDALGSQTLARPRKRGEIQRGEHQRDSQRSKLFEDVRHLRRRISKVKLSVYGHEGSASQVVPDDQMEDILTHIAALKEGRVPRKKKGDWEKTMRQLNLSLFSISVYDDRLHPAHFFDVRDGSRAYWQAYHYAFENNKARKQKEDDRLVKRINNRRTIAPFADVRRLIQRVQQIWSQEKRWRGKKPSIKEMKEVFSRILRLKRVTPAEPEKRAWNRALRRVNLCLFDVLFWDNRVAVKHLFDVAQGSMHYWALHDRALRGPQRLEGAVESS